MGAWQEKFKTGGAKHGICRKQLWMFFWEQKGETSRKKWDSMKSVTNSTANDPNWC